MICMRSPRSVRPGFCVVELGAHGRYDGVGGAGFDQAGLLLDHFWCDAWQPVHGWRWLMSGLNDANKAQSGRWRDVALSLVVGDRCVGRLCGRGAAYGTFMEAPLLLQRRLNQVRRACSKGMA